MQICHECQKELSEPPRYSVDKFEREEDSLLSPLKKIANHVFCSELCYEVWGNKEEALVQKERVQEDAAHAQLDDYSTWGP